MDSAPVCCVCCLCVCLSSKSKSAKENAFLVPQDLGEERGEGMVGKGWVSVTLPASDLAQKEPVHLNGSSEGHSPVGHQK